MVAVQPRGWRKRHRRKAQPDIEGIETTRVVGSGAIRTGRRVLNLAPGRSGVPFIRSPVSVVRSQGSCAQIEKASRSFPKTRPVCPGNKQPYQ